MPSDATAQSKSPLPPFFKGGKAVPPFLRASPFLRRNVPLYPL